MPCADTSCRTGFHCPHLSDRFLMSKLTVRQGFSLMLAHQCWPNRSFLTLLSGGHCECFPGEMRYRCCETAGSAKPMKHSQPDMSGCGQKRQKRSDAGVKTRQRGGDRHFADLHSRMWLKRATFVENHIAFWLFDPRRYLTAAKWRIACRRPTLAGILS